MLYRKPEMNNRGSFFFFFSVSLQLTRFCRIENEKLLDKLEIGTSFLSYEDLVMMNKLLF